MLGRALNRTFWVFYDNLFKGLLLNLILFAVYFSFFIVMWAQKSYTTGMFFIGIAWIGLMWHILTPAVMHYWLKVIRNDDRKNMFAEVWEGLMLFGLKGLGFFLINAAAAYLIYIGNDFYKAHVSNKIFLVLGGIAIWLAFTFLLVQIYLMPIMVMDEKRRMFISYKKSLIMLLSAPLSSLGVFAVIAYLEVLFFFVVKVIVGPQANNMLVFITGFPAFLLPFFTIISVILLQLNATMLIYEKHNIMPSLKESWEEKKWSNIFRPWDMK